MPDFVIWTGDSADHGIYDDPMITTKGAAIVSKDLDEMFKDSIIFPIHGNHEFAPSNNQNMSETENEVIDILAETWETWITPEVKKEFQEKSYFSYNATTHPKSSEEFRKKMNGTRIISLNTQN